MDGSICSGSLIVVFLTNTLDYLLLTAVVPILPEILMAQDMTEGNLTITYTNVTMDTTYSSRYAFSTNPTSTLEQSYLDMNILNGSLTKNIFRMSFEHVDENYRVGWLLSSKALVQLIVNPIAGKCCNRFGHPIVLFIGTCVLLLSTLTYSFSSKFVVLLFARMAQGFGSAATNIAGMSLLAGSYTEDNTRSKMMGIAMGALALGVVFGYPFGGVLYAYGGQLMPFMVLAGLVLLDVVLQAIILKPFTPKKGCIGVASTFGLLKDSYILIASGAIMFSTISMATLESSVPIWVIQKMHAEKWQLALVFLPDSIGYFIGTNCFGTLTKKWGRWICSMVCMWIIAVSAFCIPFATSIVHLIVPHFCLGLGLGIVDAAIMPLLALLVDTRHVAEYGSVYAMAQFSVCLAYGLGPAAGGEIISWIGFKGLMWMVAILNVIYSPFCFFLKIDLDNSENKPILFEEEKNEVYETVKQ